MLKNCLSRILWQKTVNDLINLEYGVIKYLCVERQQLQYVACARLMKKMLTLGGVEGDVHL